MARQPDLPIPCACGFRGIDRLVTRRVFGVDPIEIVVAVNVHPVGRLALDEQLQAVANFAELELRSFAGHLKRVFRLGAEGHNGINDGRRIAKRLWYRRALFLPRLAIHGNGNLWADVRVRLFAGKNPARGLPRFSTFTSLPVLILISASEATRYCLSVSSQTARRRTSASSSTGTTCRVLRWSFAVRRLCACCRDCSRSYAPKLPASGCALVAVEQRTVRTGDIHALCLGDGVAQVVRRRVESAQRFHGTVEFRLQSRQQGERLPGASGGPAFARGTVAGNRIASVPSTQTMRITRLRIDVLKECLTYYLTRPRNIQCTPARRGTQTARSMPFR